MTSECHGHGHHGHGHSHGQINHHTSSIQNIKIAFFLNLSFALIELFGGWWTHSVAIQADAIHDFGDSLVLLSALTLQHWSAVAAKGRFTFGFKRLSLLSALGASVVIFSGSVVIIVSAFGRLAEPRMPHLDGMLWLALLGVAVNGYAAWRIGHGHSQNERALSWHMLEDLLGWVAVLIGSIVMRFYHVPWLDPAMSLVIAGFIILGSARNIWASSQLFLQAAPPVDLESIRGDVLSLSDAKSITALKSWSLDGVHHVASLQVVVPANLDAAARSLFKKSVKDIFAKRGEFEVTVELDER
jgi:cobalt-zinc-cadmium efflux system protein